MAVRSATGAASKPKLAWPGALERVAEAGVYILLFLGPYAPRWVVVDRIGAPGLVEEFASTLFYVLDIPLLLAVSAWLALHLLDGSRSIRVGPPFLIAPLALLAAGSGLSVVWAAVPVVALEMFVRVAWVTLLYLLIVNQAHVPSRAAWALCGGLLVHASVATIQFWSRDAVGLFFLGEWLPAYSAPGRWLRGYGFAPNANILAGYALIGLAAVAGLYLTERSRGRRFVLAALFAVGVSGLISTFSRAAWLGIGFATLFALVVLGRTSVLRSLRPLMLTAAAVALIYLAAAPDLFRTRLAVPLVYRILAAQERQFVTAPDGEAPAASLPRTVAVSEAEPFPDGVQDSLWLANPIAASFQTQRNLEYPFGSDFDGRLLLHRGIDIENPTGTPVQSTGDGIVVHAGPDNATQLGPSLDFYGQAVVVQNNLYVGRQPVFTLYGHVGSVFVRPGQPVQAGEFLASVGETGVALGPHLHLEIRIGENSYDHAANPDLWIAPQPGRGVIAGRVLDAAGFFVPEQPVSLHDAEAPDVFLRVVTTYPASILETQPEGSRGESFAFGDVPPGSYLLKTGFDGWRIALPVTVESGKITYATLQTVELGRAERLWRTLLARLAPVEDDATLPDHTELVNLAARSKYRTVAWEMMSDSWPLGVGSGNYSVAWMAREPGYGLGGLFLPVHNTPLLLAAELGPVGLLAWCALLFGFAFAALRSRKRLAQDPWLLVWTLALIALLTTSFFDFYLWGWQYGRLMLWPLLGLWAVAYTD